MAQDIGDDEMRFIRPYYGGDPRVPRTVNETPLCEYRGAEWSLTEFVKLVGGILHAIPAEFRESATVDFDGGAYDESASLKISYTRPETPEEIARRVSEAIQYAHAQAEKERATYEALKRKFADR